MSQAEDQRGLLRYIGLGLGWLRGNRVSREAARIQGSEVGGKTEHLSGKVQDKWDQSKTAAYNAFREEFYAPMRDRIRTLESFSDTFVEPEKLVIETIRRRAEIAAGGGPLVAYTPDTLQGIYDGLSELALLRREALINEIDPEDQQRFKYVGLLNGLVNWRSFLRNAPPDSSEAIFAQRRIGTLAEQTDSLMRQMQEIGNGGPIAH